MEKVCGICGISESKARLTPAISGREVILACSKCLEMEDLIKINRPTEEQLSYANKAYTVRERLAKAMGTTSIKKQEAPKPIPTPSLYCLSSYRKSELPIKLVENFHWKIMMARKDKKISQNLLAERIGEDVSVVKTIESGCITRESERVLRKIESALRIRLIESSQPMPISSPQTSSSQIPEKTPDGKILVTRENIRTLKVGDLIRVREEIETKKSQPRMLEAEEAEASEEVIDLDEDFK